RLVQGVLARWIPLAETLRDMERVAYTTRLGLTERREAALPHWKAIQEFLDATPEDPSSRAVARALAGWARVLAGHEDEGRDWMRQARDIDPDLPYGAFVEALSWFSSYMAKQPLPDVYSGETGLRFGAPHAETHEMRRIREEVEELLVRASSAQVWGEGLAQEFQGALTAVRAVQRGEYEEADRALTEAIASPTMEVFRTELLFARGKARYLLQRFDGAVEDLERVRAVRSEWADAWYFVAAVRAGAGIALGREGKDPRTALAKAVEGFGEALARNPRHVPALLGRGNTRQMLGDADGALADYDAVTAIDPNEAVPYLNRGTIRYMRREFEAAEKDYDAALARNDGLVEAWVGKGLLRGRLGDPTGAVRAFDRALAAAPDDLKALLERGDVKRRCGDRDGAHADFEHAVKAHPRSTEALVRRGYSWMNADRYAEALADFDAVIAIDPEDAEAHAGRGATILGMEKPKEAIAALDKAHALNPSHPEVLVNRSIAKQRLGDDAGALADADEAVRAAPDFLHAVNRRAVLRIGAGDLAGALADLERVLELSGPKAKGDGIVEAHYNLACLYAQRSAGVDRRGEAPRPVDADRAQEWRGLAFGHLARAIEMGWRNREQLEKDPDLMPLREDARWNEILERIPK
ncbi:MAG: tetratricopeptide repeat protein, partial [Planctomycetota bacterium]